MIKSNELIPQTKTSNLLYPSGDRLRDATLFVDSNGNYFWSTWSSYSFPSSSDDIFHTVQNGEEGRLDYMSFTYYGTYKYWWVIAVANNIFNPIEDIVANITLRIPSIITILKIVN